ncbi:coagulation factor XIII B chain-like isoform 2-T2 [Discoglossus pictus]
MGVLAGCTLCIALTVTSWTGAIEVSGQGKSPETCQMSPLENGNFLPNKKVFDAGEHLQYKCDEGYMSPLRNLVEEVVCLPSGWSATPQCVEITCSVQSAHFRNLRESYRGGEVEHFSCRDGLKLQGSEVSQCYYYGWDPTLPTCRDGMSTCPPPPHPDNTEGIPLKGEFSNGDVVQIKCKPGFQLHGSDSILCKNRSWTSPPQCVRAKKCIEPPAIQSGTFSPNSKKKEYTRGSTVTYTCNNGYKMAGSKESLCLGGTWSSAPVCMKLGQSCSAPPNIINGEVKTLVQSQYSSGSTVEYQCQNYYKAQGSLKVTCEHGLWSDPPVCLEPCTVAERELRINNIKLKWSEVKKLYSAHGDAVEFLCLPGFKPQQSANLRVQCKRGKLDYPRCFKQGSCMLSQDAMASNFIEAKNNQLELEEGKSVDLQCVEDMVPERGQTLKVTCIKGKIEYPKCIKQSSCMLSKEIMARNFIVTKNVQLELEEGKSVDILCMEEMVPEAGQTLRVTCNKGKIEYPRCIQQINFPDSCKLSNEKISQNNLVLPRNAPVDKTYAHGEKIIVRCKPRYYHSSISLIVECYKGIMDYPKCFNAKPCRLNQERLDENNLDLGPVHDGAVYYENGLDIIFVCKPGYASDTQPTGHCVQEDIIYPSCHERSDSD